MATNYRIRVHVEIEECADGMTAEPSKEGIGAFARVISAEQACSIDECEQIMLQIDYEALRDAFAQHLSTVSQCYALQQAGALDGCEVKVYRVDGEVGRITFQSYWVEPVEGADSTPSPFPLLHAQEWYRTTGFKEVALAYGTCEESYRKAGALINRMRHQEDATPARTLRENTEYEGLQIMAHLKQRAATILAEHGFTEEGVPTESAAHHKGQALVTLPAQPVEQATQACAPGPEWLVAMAGNPLVYEDATRSTNISLDDVGVKRQKATRQSSEGSTQEAKRAYNTVAHIAHASQSYIITGQGVASVLRLVLAFLLNNRLLSTNLIFFVDGQRTLYTTILSAFAWLTSFQIVLDWFHLEKRCKEQLSLALKGRHMRNALLEQLLPCLWHGCVDRAIALLQSLEMSQIKNPEALADLIGYLERNRSHIPCYSVRKRLGLPNSSNRGEKANDLVVSDRQKHNGMSWSKLGSAALATVTALVKNQEYKRWFQTGTLSFAFCPSG